MSDARQRAFWRDPGLGDPRTLELAAGKMRVFEAGSGPPIVFVHGALVNANLWRKVIPRLSPDFHCIALDVPLGSHELAMPGADLSPTGLANLIADAIEALGIEGATLVGNDTGGALCQLVIAHRPERIERLVLTSCDAYEDFPPTFFKFLLAPLAVPALGRGLFAPLRIRALRELPIAFGWLMHSRLEPAAGDSYVLPVLVSKEIGKDTARVMGGIHPRYLQEAAERFGSFDRPVLIAWSRDDRFFKPRNGERLARDFPNARLEWIEEARTFSAEDQPERLAELIAGFVREPAPQAIT
jgi:pimeloyl-ACP methyl ester carboxylesterase